MTRFCQPYIYGEIEGSNCTTYPTLIDTHNQHYYGDNALIGGLRVGAPDPFNNLVAFLVDDAMFDRPNTDALFNTPAPTVEIELVHGKCLRILAL